jgi:hypothetical protein
LFLHLKQALGIPEVSHVEPEEKASGKKKPVFILQLRYSSHEFATRFPFFLSVSLSFSHPLSPASTSLLQLILSPSSLQLQSLRFVRLADFALDPHRSCIFQIDKSPGLNRTLNSGGGKKTRSGRLKGDGVTGVAALDNYYCSISDGLESGRKAEKPKS